MLVLTALLKGGVVPDDMPLVLAFGGGGVQYHSSCIVVDAYSRWRPGPVGRCALHQSSNPTTGS